MLARRLGITYDLTLEPGYGEEPLFHPAERVTGSLPDTRRVPVLPFQPDADDYQRPDGASVTNGANGANGSAAFWAIPMSTAHVDPGLLRKVYYRVRYPGRRLDTWTALLSHHPAMFDRIITHVLARPRPYLAMPMRTNALADRRIAPARWREPRNAVPPDRLAPRGSRDAGRGRHSAGT